MNSTPEPSAVRWKVVAAALGIAGLAASWVSHSSPETIELVDPDRDRGRADSRSLPGTAGTEIRLADLRSARGGKVNADAFAARSWHVAAPAEVVEFTPAPQPELPSQPFSYIGKMVYDGRTSVFIESEGQSYIVREGDIVGGTYRIDSIRGPLMEWTFLPQDRKQTMHIGDEN